MSLTLPLASVRVLDIGQVPAAIAARSFFSERSLLQKGFFEIKFGFATQSGAA